MLEPGARRYCTAPWRWIGIDVREMPVLSASKPDAKSRTSKRGNPRDMLATQKSLAAECTEKLVLVIKF